MSPVRSIYVCCAICAINLIIPLDLSGCAPPTPVGSTAVGSYSDQLTANVIGVNKAKRQLTLQGPNGGVVTFQVSDAVRNFDQIRVGDMVRVGYQEQVIAQVNGSNTPPLDGVIVQINGGRAAKGQKPGNMLMVTATRSVEIISVDRATHTITFREGDGALDSFVVQNPQNYAFADGLQPGTVVDVTETATLAVQVEKV